MKIPYVNRSSLRRLGEGRVILSCILVQEVATISKECLSNQKEEGNKTRILF
jgi:hypothetical protein